MAKKNEHVGHKKSLLLSIGGGVFGLYVFFIFVEAFLFSSSFGPNVLIAGVDISNLSPVKAKDKLENAWSGYKTSNILIDGENYPIEGLVTSADFEKSINTALANQRNLYFSLGVLRSQRYALSVSANDDALYKILTSSYDKSQKASKNANILFGQGTKIVPSEDGNNFLLAENRSNILSALSNMDGNVSFRTAVSKANVTTDEATQLLELANNATSKDIVVKTTKDDQVIPTQDLRNWLQLSSASNSLVASNSDYLWVNDAKYGFFNPAKVNDWIDTLAKKVNQKAVNARLTISEGKATIFTPSQVGQELDTNDLAQKIQDAATGEKTVTANIATTQPDVTEGTLNNLGINELVSSGWSDFRGSPPNRLHNLTVGASKFNGVLIKPGEEFSFNKTLGPVDASTGYLPELVILENKTVPQYGGGMCQVSSTAFRAALNAGLPILERLNHAYPVQYYKPYGVDATIYLPKPDLVFTNDTDHYILIQTYIQGTQLHFDFYGTKPARTVKFSGNKDANGAVEAVEKVNPTLYDQDVRGPGSFTAVFYRHIYDLAGKLTDNDKFTSKYDSPSKYPH